MKKLKLKIFSGLSMLLLIIILSSFQKKSGYVITGEIKNLADGTTIQMIPIDSHKEEKPIDSAVIINGKFVLKGNVKTPRFYWMKVEGEAYTGFSIMVDNENIHVSGNAKLVTNEGKTIHQLTGIKITGSKAHDLFVEKTAFRDKLENLYEEYHKNNKIISDQVDDANSKKDSVLYKKLIASDAYKKFESDEKAFFDTVGARTERQIIANKDSWWGPFLMLNQYSYFTPEQKKLYDQLSSKAKESYFGKVVASELYPVSHIGKKAPSLAFTDENKQPVPFNQIAAGKKYIIIDFWASWCAPCRRSIPGLKDFYKEMAANGVTIISVSIDKDSTAWVKANNEEKFPWHSFLDRQGIADAYSVKAIPAMFLLDDKGKVVAENTNLEEITQKIKQD